MKDLKLIAVNRVHQLNSQAVMNTRIKPLENPSQAELKVYIQELTTLMQKEIQDHLELQRITRANHKDEIARLMLKIGNLQK
jgi:hypothetical protein